MATEKLYDQDAHQAQFQATVLSCRPGKHGYDVVLDRTCFYPEGGGQPGDTGVLSGVRVTDTHEAGGEIVHYCEAPLAEGQTVEGTIDYERRFEFMQLHTGEHILSGVIHRRFGYENVGFHMGADFVTIDLSGMLTPEQVQSVEAEANEWIWKTSRSRSRTRTRTRSRPSPTAAKGADRAGAHRDHPGRGYLRVLRHARVEYRRNWPAADLLVRQVP